jgi:hypothetical protein
MCGCACSYVKYYQRLFCSGVRSSAQGAFRLRVHRPARPNGGTLRGLRLRACCWAFPMLQAPPSSIVTSFWGRFVDVQWWSLPGD